jgi:nitrate reductase assembly molybdenum cofactor insertion protein NarJ
LIIGMMLGTVILFALAEVTSGLGHALALLREAALAQAQADRMRMFDRSRT